MGRWLCGIVYEKGRWGGGDVRAGGLCMVPGAEKPGSVGCVNLKGGYYIKDLYDIMRGMSWIKNSPAAFSA